MIKVILVEDEFLIREGIKNNIDWEKNGYELVGDAGDGELALPLITRLQPDIVITDIKMPFMNGLELSRVVKETLPNTEIVILSGYDEFEYAKEGIKLGVAEYLLKPVSGDDLLKSLNKIKERIESKKKEQELYIKYQQETAENRVLEQRSFFNMLVKGNASVMQIMDMASKVGIRLSGSYYNLALFKTYSVNHDRNEYSASVQAIMDRLNVLTEEQGVFMFDRDPEGVAFLFMAESESELMTKQTLFLSELEDYLKQYESLRYFAGIGDYVNRASELSISYEKAGRAFAHRFLMEGNHMVNCDDLKGLTHDTEEVLNLGTIHPKQLNNTKILDFVKTGDADEAGVFVEEFFHEIGSAANSSMFRQYTVMNTYFTVVDFVESLGQSRELLKDTTTLCDRSFTLDETMAYITQILKEAIEIRDSVSHNRNDDAIDKVKAYIDEHFADEDLSLSEIAAYVNFSSNHLSQIFRQTTGQTLIKYLTDYRLTKAKELLRCTNLKSNEISEQVGYQDPHYFSYLFKKTFGVTPTQYKEGK